MCPKLIGIWLLAKGWWGRVMESGLHITDRGPKYSQLKKKEKAPPPPLLGKIFPTMNMGKN